jgi:hypothetical protein
MKNKNKRSYNGPWHTHDCDTCTYLGSEVVKGKQFDFYVHLDGMPTIIARYGADGKYSSGTSFVFSSPYLNIALKKVFEQNIPLSDSFRKQIRYEHKCFLVDHDKFFANTNYRFKKLGVERFLPEDPLAVEIAKEEIAHQLRCAELLRTRK